MIISCDQSQQLCPSRAARMRRLGQVTVIFPPPHLVVQSHRRVKVSSPLNLPPETVALVVLLLLLAFTCGRPQENQAAKPLSCSYSTSPVVFPSSSSSSTISKTSRPFLFDNKKISSFSLLFSIFFLKGVQHIYTHITIPYSNLKERKTKMSASLYKYWKTGSNCFYLFFSFTFPTLTFFSISTFTFKYLPHLPQIGPTGLLARSPYLVTRPRDLSLHILVYKIYFFPLD